MNGSVSWPTLYYSYNIRYQNVECLIRSKIRVLKFVTATFSYKFSDYGPIERYISETLQDRR